MLLLLFSQWFFCSPQVSFMLPSTWKHIKTLQWKCISVLWQVCIINYDFELYYRRLGSSNSLSKDVNHNKIVPASPEQKSLPSGPAEVNHTISSFFEHGMTQNLHSDQNSHDHVKQSISQHNSINDISEDAVERYVRSRKTRYWCFPGNPIRLKKGRSWSLVEGEAEMAKAFLKKPPLTDYLTSFLLNILLHL